MNLQEDNSRLACDLRCSDTPILKASRDRWKFALMLRFHLLYIRFLIGLGRERDPTEVSGSSIGIKAHAAFSSCFVGTEETCI